MIFKKILTWLLVVGLVFGLSSSVFADPPFFLGDRLDKVITEVIEKSTSVNDLREVFSGLSMTKHISSNEWDNLNELKKNGNKEKIVEEIMRLYNGNLNFKFLMREYYEKVYNKIKDELFKPVRKVDINRDDIRNHRRHGTQDN